jgi:hypothetical protein
MVFASLCAAALIKQLAITDLPHSGEDYGIFLSRIKRATQNVKDGDAVLSSAQRRVQDVFLKLNLGMEVIRNEVIALQGSDVGLPNGARTAKDTSK